MKPKKCKNPECKKQFIPRYSTLEKYCSPACAFKSSPNKQIKPLSDKGIIRKAEEVKYYQAMWNLSAKNGICRCEECNMELMNYSAKYVSHILSRKAHPKLALHPLNHNILCSGLRTNNCHSKWETGERKSMKIYESNLVRIEKLMEIEQKL